MGIEPGYKLICNSCEKEDFIRGEQGMLNWIEVTTYEEASPPSKLVFCSQECLVKWAGE